MGMDTLSGEINIKVFVLPFERGFALKGQNWLLTGAGSHLFPF